MSEGFKITGPGRYMTRSEGVAVITGHCTRPGYAWDGYMEHDDSKHDWAEAGKFAAYYEGELGYDIIARVDVPQPDAQDRIVGLESPNSEQWQSVNGAAFLPYKSIDPLARLEAWANGGDERYFDMSRDFARLRFGGVTITTVGDTTVEAITKALDIAEGVK